MKPAAVSSSNIELAGLDHYSQRIILGLLKENEGLRAQIDGQRVSIVILRDELLDRDRLIRSLRQGGKIMGQAA